MTPKEQMMTPAYLSSSSTPLIYQSLLIDILSLSLEPDPFTTKINRVLDKLLAPPELQFGPKAALFLVDHGSSTLSLKVSKGFPVSEKINCSEARLGLCHCGSTALTGEIQFFTTPPPLRDVAGHLQPFPGNYCIPIVKDGEPLGVLTIYVKPKHIQSQEITTLLEAIATILAVIIEGQQMDQQLVQLVNDLRGSIINLREEKKFSESIIQGLNHGLIVVDLNGQIRKSNSVAKSILKPLNNIIDGEHLPEILGNEIANQLIETLPNESPQPEREISFTSPSGDKKIIGFSNVAREDARGRKVGVIISLSDISELKYVRKEMEKMNRLSTVAEIASAVAHEVRNPLAGIKIMAQSIEEEAKDQSEQLECSQRIIRQVDRLNELLSDFFSYARPAEPNKRATSLGAIICETKPLIKNRLHKVNIQLNEKINDSLPQIIADPHQVQQVFLNLFLNAIDAIGHDGRIDISATLLSQKLLTEYQKKYPAILQNCVYVMVNFTDNGSGMSSETAEQVFEPFFTTKNSGAGLGLSIVYRTLKENDAAIVLESEIEHGTTFTIFFRADL